MANKKCFLFFLLIFLILSANVLSAPLINSFEVNCNENIQAGDSITATVKGISGAQVWIEISNVPIKIYLPEISPGVYQGTYTLTPDLPSVYRSSVFAHLEINGKECSPAVGRQKITILGSGPLFYDLSPLDGTMVRDLKPTIYAAIDGRGSGVDVSSLKVIVNRQDVTLSRETLINPGYITFVPSDNLKEGENRIYLYGRTTNGNEFLAEWHFFIKMASSINSVSHNATHTLKAGDVLEVHLIGDPYQKAYFDIGDWKKGLPMNESFRSPGTYIGTYAIQKGDYVINAPVTGYLDIQGGGTVSLQSSIPVTIMTDDLVIRIMQPNDGQTVTKPFILKGQTRPLTTVHLDFQITYVILGMGSVTSPGTIIKELNSNEMGVFEYKVMLPDAPPGSEYKITAIAIDAQGNKSQPHVIKLYQQ